MIKANTKHNGWTNRATWAVNLWLTNDEMMFSRAVDYARDSKGCESTFNYHIEKMLHNWDEIVEDCDDFEDVNWAEILRITFEPIFAAEPKK